MCPAVDYQRQSFALVAQQTGFRKGIGLQRDATGTNDTWLSRQVHYTVTGVRSSAIYVGTKTPLHILSITDSKTRWDARRKESRFKYVASKTDNKMTSERSSVKSLENGNETLKNETPLAKHFAWEEWKTPYQNLVSEEVKQRSLEEGGMKFSAERKK